MEQHIDYLISHFGYFGIIIALIGGIVGLPIPDEVLLTYVGYKVFQGTISYIPSLLSAFVGAMGGISLSYFIGFKFGLPLIKKFGPKIHITEKKINRTQKLFLKIGPFLILIGFFIPGIRHLTAYVAALNSFPFRKFAAYAYIGAFIWSLSFITLGRKLGENWGIVDTYVSKYSMYLILFFLVLSLMVYLIWRRKKQLGKV
ncbi:DedA family protein [Paenibacillus sp. BSR1-1]|uniref:DedA family protein n=1 Tax=Paenibacillus sp. BSR1-1 TaxID=3020845 RepID=UPI0025B03679|nr:DedA family protein [Paenibacillus sp. BSR1-1]MDN3016219.1 DedA family protein [Paenibacillus sp. BSR1-1]